MKNIREQVYAIISSTLEVRREDIKLSSTWSDYAADSFAIVELILALEEHFRISFRPSELEDIHNVGDVVAAVERKVTK